MDAHGTAMNFDTKCRRFSFMIVLDMQYDIIQFLVTAMAVSGAVVFDRGIAGFNMLQQFVATITNLFLYFVFVSGPQMSMATNPKVYSVEIIVAILNVFCDGLCCLQDSHLHTNSCTPDSTHGQ